MAENKLMLCAGHVRRFDWKTLDGDPKHGGDFIAMIPPLPASVKQIRWNEIEWVHGITSLYPWDAEKVLVELFAVLAPGGKLVLEQPDYRCASEEVRSVFGDPVQGNPLHMNRWAYTPQSLLAVVMKAGFEQVRTMAAQHHLPARDFRLEATK